MKFTISKQQLLLGLQAVQNAVPTRTTLPTLSHVHLNANGSELQFTASDLNITISCTVEANISVMAQALLPAKRLIGIVKEMPGESIEIEVDEKFVGSIRSGSAAYKIHGLNPIEFPAITQPNRGRKFTMPQSRLKAILRRTMIAMAIDRPDKPELHGVYLNFKGKQVEVVAIDGHRMAQENTELKDEFGEGGVIIPKDSVSELVRSLQAEGAVEFECDFDKCASFTLTNDGVRTVITTQLLNMQYPNYAHLTASWKPATQKLVLQREEFVSALKRASFITFEKAAAVYLILSKNNLCVWAQVPGVGEAREDIPVLYGGEDIKLSFNPSYILDVLNVFDSDAFVMSFVDIFTPARFSIEGPDFTYSLIGLKQ